VFRPLLAIQNDFATGVRLCASAHRWVDNKLDANSLWAKEVKDRRNFNIDSMAMANKMVRIAYALLSKGESFRTDTASVSMA